MIWWFDGDDLYITNEIYDNFDKEFVDDFLKEQMPLDPDWDDKQEAEKIRKNKLISKKLNESFEQ